MRFATFISSTAYVLVAITVCYGETRTYSFTARIEKNGGVTTFKHGSTIKGWFTYDTTPIDQKPDDPRSGRYVSPKNTFVFQYGDYCFSGAGEIAVTIGVYEHAEHFQIVAFHLQLPPGWDMKHVVRSQTYGIVLQNAPPTGAVPNDAIPDYVDLSRFITTRELRLDFLHGIRFPSGEVDERATVYATVETLGPLAIVPKTSRFCTSVPRRRCFRLFRSCKRRW